MMARASLADLRRGEIVDSAIRVLARTGVEGLTMRGLATELGVSTGTITHWFPTKDDVLRASLDEAAERVGRRVDVALEGVEDPRGILRAIADASIPEDEQGREEQRVWLELGARATRVAALAELHDRLYAGWRRRIERAVRRGIDDGSFRVVDTRRWALAYAALIDGLALHVLLHPGIDANEMHRVVEAHLDGTLG
jgi:AcrR family transcriptional regulator